MGPPAISIVVTSTGQQLRYCLGISLFLPLTSFDVSFIGYFIQIIKPLPLSLAEVLSWKFFMRNLSNLFSENIACWLSNYCSKSGMAPSVLSRQCGLHKSAVSRYIRKRNQPMLFTIEKLCYCLGVSPNDLLLTEQGSVTSYRMPLRVKEAVLFMDCNCYSLCPKCNCTLSREYQSFCDRCGQCLSWAQYPNVEIHSINVIHIATEYQRIAQYGQ